MISKNANKLILHQKKKMKTNKATCVMLHIFGEGFIWGYWWI
jgi:hypothetical protein